MTDNNEIDQLIDLGNKAPFMRGSVVKAILEGTKPQTLGLHLISEGCPTGRFAFLHRHRMKYIAHNMTDFNDNGWATYSTQWRCRCGREILQIERASW